ncbi:MAG: cobyric acid synthase [Breznakibacter sp.]
MQSLRPIMFAGTCSDAGKSVINAAFCRILKQDGYHPAPFKAQNMSLNSYATPDGLELGRAQAVQAEACGIPCCAEMNPVLLKPSGEMSSQVVLHGKPMGNQTASHYFSGDGHHFFFDEAFGAFERLSQRYAPIVMEGAGSVSELNLKARDIVNMRMAKRAGAAVYLISDIDRGGVFASVYGSVLLLPEDERRLIKGIIINKFRGNLSLFEEGRTILQQITGIPVVGVIPYFKDIYIEDEDSVVLGKKNQMAMPGKVNVGVVLLNQMSNFTDFAAFEFDNRVHLFYSRSAKELEKADIIILPGSKNTMADLLSLNQSGLSDKIRQWYGEGKTVVGICGGYQMMGQVVRDPLQVEGETEEVFGLGLLPCQTVMTADKKTIQTRFRYRNDAGWCSGYEIHMGETTLLEPMNPLNTTDLGEGEGVFRNEHCWGTYMHGIFDNQCVVNDLVGRFTSEEVAQFDYHQFKEEQYDKLAAHVRHHLDVEAIYRVMKGDDHA